MDAVVLSKQPLSERDACVNSSSRCGYKGSDCEPIRNQRQPFSSVASEIATQAPIRVLGRVGM